MAPPCPLPALYCHLPPCVDNSEFSVAIPITAFLLSVFPMYHIRMKNGLPRTFSSRSITSGNRWHAFQAPLWHFPVFPMCHIRMKIAILCTFGSWSITSGNHWYPYYMWKWKWRIPTISSLVHQYNAPKYKTERKNIYDSFRFEMILSIKHYFFRRLCLEFRIPLHRFADRWPSNKTTWSFTIKNGSPKLYNEQPLSFMPYGTRRSSHQKWRRCKTDYQSLCSRLLQNRNSHYDRCCNVNAPASKHLHNQPRRVSPLVIWESC